MNSVQTGSTFRKRELCHHRVCGNRWKVIVSANALRIEPGKLAGVVPVGTRHERTHFFRLIHRERTDETYG
jgi:hypothetical protein